MSYLYLLLSLISSLSIALLLKALGQQNKNQTVIIGSNYISAGTLAFLFSGNHHLTPSVLSFGIVLGFFFCLGFIFLGISIKTKGIASSVTIGRLSLAVPVILSIGLWGEKPELTDILSLLVIFFIILSWEGKIGKISPILLVIFCIFGLLDSAMKFFKLKFPSSDDGFFLVIVFYSAMVWGWIYILASRQKIRQADIYWGLLLGVPNFFSSYFLLKALFLIPAYVVFPFINIGLIILSALCGKLIFKEELSHRKMALILLGILAVFFLST